MNQNLRTPFIVSAIKRDRNVAKIAVLGQQIDPAAQVLDTRHIAVLFRKVGATLVPITRA
jgi:hypothetical protein